MRVRYLALILALGAPGALAAEAGRFTLTPTDGGYLKLDSVTGAVSLCRPRGDTMACALVPDDRQALQDEIDRLARRVAELEARGAAPSQGLPSEQELDRTLDFMEQALRRFRGLFEEGPSPPTPDRT